MYCSKCGAQNEDANRFCLSCGAALATVAVPTPAPMSFTSVTLPKPSGPVALAAPIGGIAGIVGGATSAIGWFMPWFGLGQVGSSLGGIAGLLLGSGGGGLASALGGGIGGSGFQLLLLVLQIPSLLNSFNAYGARSDTGSILGLVIVAILILVLIPILGLLNIRAGVAALQLRSTTDSISIGTVKNQLNAIINNSSFGFILLVAIFILLSQIPFATMLLSSGFFITAGGFALAWFAAVTAKGQVGTAS